MIADAHDDPFRDEAALEGFFEALLDDDPGELYERAPCGYLSTTPDGTIIKANQTFLTWTGYERADLVGRRTFAELLTGGGRIYHETHYAPMLQMQGEARAIALEIVRRDGRRLPVLVSSILERDVHGAPTVVRTAVFDATERRAYEEELLRAKQRAEASEASAVLLARTLQQTLLPATLPDVPSVELAAVFRPAGAGAEVGGDFYDVFQIGPDDWAIAIGDVCGKGVDAAVVTALARHTIRAAAVGTPEPRLVLGTLDAILLRQDDRFCTVALVRLRRSGRTWTATVSVGGHPQPLLLRRRGAVPEAIGRPGSLLGVLDSAKLYDTDVELPAGASVVLYTDGVTEGRGVGGFFGEDRLRASIAAHDTSAPALAQGILDDVLAFQRGEPRDDIAVVVLRILE